MTVNIDPSEVRRNGASVKPAPRAARFRVPLRAVLVGGLGSAGLIAFTVGAFSFFSGLADPRIRSPRVMPVAAKMPDLKDGIPALAPEAAPAAAPQATTFNLPPPASVQPQPIQPAQQAAIEPPVPQLRTDATDEPIVAEPREKAQVAAPSVAKPREAAPSIQNAAVIAEAPRTAALVPPAKAETVKAKPGQPSAFASLPVESKLDAKPPRDAEPTTQQARKPTVKPAAQKIAAHKLGKPKSAADATSVPDQAATASAEDGDAIPGTRQVRAGLKAIGGMLGISDSD